MVTSNRIDDRQDDRFYPVYLDLRGRRCVVIGGGAVGQHKIRGLLEAGATITVFSPAAAPGLEELAERGGVEILWREYRDGDLAGAALAIAATDDRAVNRAVWREALERGIPVNAVDDLDHCTFIAPSIHRQGHLAIAVSTSGRSPALAVRLREQIARSVGNEYAAFLDLLGRMRQEIAHRFPDFRERTRAWYDVVDSDAIEYVRRDDLAGAEQRIREVLAPSRDATFGDVTVDHPKRTTVKPGTVYLVGAGPGDPELITTKGRRLIRAADVLVYDRLVHAQLVALAPPRAQRLFVGKDPRDGDGSSPQAAINQLLIDQARAGKTVVRLKGGDPFVFGRGAEECEALHTAGVPFEVVPGVTSAIAVPAAALIPVTHRRHSSAFAVVTGHECEGNSDLEWETLARIPTLVVLMGLSGLDAVANQLMASGANPSTPAAVISRGTLPDQRVVHGQLASIAELVRNAGLESPATLIVGDVVRVGARLSSREVNQHQNSETAEGQVLVGGSR